MSKHQKRQSGFATLSLATLGAWFILASVSWIASAQQSPPGPPNRAPTPTNSSDASRKNLSPEEQRQADLRADTEKLYQLTQELKAEVAKSNKDTLSVSVVKKAQEIERLAKSIKERSRVR
jgi:uncharacterized membrane protein YhiD involved in acid resistance